MSYSIIFKTIIATLPDGSIIHFSRQGCKNDNAGREETEFRGKFYTAEQWEAEVSRWETMERRYDGFDLKIGSRYCEWADYGKHLRRMTGRAKPLSAMIGERYVSGTVYDGIRYFPEEGDPVDYPPGKEADNVFYDLLYGRKKGGYRDLTHSIRTEEEIEQALRNKEHVEFYIGKAR